MRPPAITWPDGKRFAFTVFDDTDRTTMERGPDVYALLKDLGMRTTKSVWPIRGEGKPRISGATCEDPEYLAWVRSLQRDGFEIAMHNASNVSCQRSDTLRALEAFREMFGSYPNIQVNHASNRDSLYWGPSRLSPRRRLLYRLLTRNRTNGHDGGSDPLSKYFWGDLAQSHVTYVRNFVYSDINTLKACPFMPYHDPSYPFVNYWFASSEGGKGATFCNTIREENQDRLEEEGGACIMYAHFGTPGFRQDGKLHPRFVELMTRLAVKGGWFVPVSQLLDYLRAQRSEHAISPGQRRRLEQRWLYEKVFVTRGTS